MKINIDWNYKMIINDVYWKGYGDKPTHQQINIEKQSFLKSSFYEGGEIEVYVINTKGDNNGNQTRTNLQRM